MVAKKRRSRSQPASSGSSGSKSSGGPQVDVDAYYKPIKITVYRNGDPFTPGLHFTIARRYHRHWMKFLDDLTARLDMVKSVHFLFTIRGKEVNTFQQLKDGREYVAVDDKFRSVDYGKAPQLTHGWVSTPRPDKISAKDSSTLDSPESLDIYLHKMGFTTRQGNPKLSYQAVKPKEPKSRVPRAGNPSRSPSKNKPPKPKAKSPRKKSHSPMKKAPTSPRKTSKQLDSKPSKAVKKKLIKRKKKESLTKSHLSEGDEPHPRSLNEDEDLVVLGNIPTRSPSPLVPSSKATSPSYSNPVTRENSDGNLRAKSKQSMRLSNLARRDSTAKESESDEEFDKGDTDYHSDEHDEIQASRPTTSDQSSRPHSASSRKSRNTASRNSGSERTTSQSSAKASPIVSHRSRPQTGNSLASTALSTSATVH